ncbi:GNAT family N-acetyltransferase [Anaerosolibacter sp.]|uniref:GNAT family N-acetyltransferase n=1 Tax=Anaerosolibacter sp. TaxID=1872527 RepID=UPI0039EE2B70
MTLKIRLFNNSLEDAAKLKIVDQLTFQDCHYSEERIIEIALDQRNKIFIAEIDGEMIGFISLLQVQTLHYKGIWVDLIAVIPPYQNQGVGSKLLEQGKEYSKTLGVDFISGLVAVHNTGSQGAFKKSGFSTAEKDFNLFLWEGKNNG